MPQKAVVDIVDEPSAVKLARHVACERLGEWHASVDADVVALLVSELVSELVTNALVTNALVHGSQPAEMQLAWDGTTLRISVHDAAVASVPTVASSSPHADSGRGLHLLDALADEWGVDVAEGEKSVWFEVQAR